MWVGDSMSILVSINCITYNHEKFIDKAIESFINQITDFEFEIVIGEDCSTDGTLEIVKEYEKQYPSLIRLITDSKNVGMSKNSRRILDASVGEYIAICEGDDYWTDPFKLQKQVDFFKRHKECSLVFHAADIINVETGLIEGEIRPFKRTFIYPENKLFFGGGDFVATASMMFKKSLMIDLPDFYVKSPVGDHAMALLLSYRGRVGYINEKMAVRSLWVPGSWNTSMNKKQDEERKIKHILAMCNVLHLYNAYTNNKYQSEVKKRILNGLIQVAELQRLEPFEQTEIIKIYSSLKLIDKLKVKIGYICPSLYHIYSKVLP